VLATLSISYAKGGASTTTPKSFHNLTIKVPGMTLEEKLHIFIKGLKTNIQISVAMQDPRTIEQAKILAASADAS
jgi:hypothetical protein